MWLRTRRSGVRVPPGAPLLSAFVLNDLEEEPFVGFELSLKSSMPRVRTRFQVLELSALPDHEPVT
jgi:hypothetical protein